MKKTAKEIAITAAKTEALAIAEDDTQIAQTAATAEDQEVFDAVTDAQKDTAATMAIAETAEKQTAADDDQEVNDLFTA